MTGLLKNVIAGARLAFFLPVRAHHFRVSAIDFSLLALLGFALWVVAAAARLGFEGQFEPASIHVYLAGTVLVLAAAMLVALAYGAPAQLLLIAVALYSLEPVFSVVIFVLTVTDQMPLWLQVSAFYAVLVWFWIACLRAVAVCAGARRPQLFVAAAVVTGLIALDLVLPQTEPWVEEEEALPPAPLASERLFHLQGELIERSLAAIQPGRAGTRELYFVGFAPDASQDVFVKEMRFVKRLFDERLGAAGRSIALASSTDALEEFPIASVTNLGRALQRVGGSMNTDEDVLFLFLSAHGDRAHRLSASQPPLDLAPVTPTSLARLLHDAGIKWRIIVVSACYSGGYIEPLRDANTVVITAAASDRTSFGCEGDRDFTYFGQAFFRDALAKTRSFTKAFDLAKEIVTQQETSEKLTPSMPQIWVGASIAERLGTMD